MSRQHCGKWPPDPRCTARNAVMAAGRIVNAVVRGKKVRVPDEVQQERLAICLQPCEHLVKTQGGALRCRACTCYLGGVMGKTQWSTEFCPRHKWGTFDILPSLKEGDS